MGRFGFEALGSLKKNSCAGCFGPLSSCRYVLKGVATIMRIWGWLAVTIVGLYLFGLSLSPINHSRPHVDNIFEAVDHGNLTEVKALLKDHPELITARRYDNTLLCLAAGGGYKEIVQLLLADKADVNEHGQAGFTPLHCAAEGYHKDVMELLLANHADVNAGDQSGITPLVYTMDKDRPDVVAVLLAHGADINNAYGNSSWTPLHYAADHNSIAVARLLLAHKVNVNAKDKDDRTPMFYAAQKGYSGMVQLLTQNGGNK